MGLMISKKMDSKIEENVIYHELNKYTICCLKASTRVISSVCGQFHPMLDDLKTSILSCVVK